MNTSLSSRQLQKQQRWLFTLSELFHLRPHVHKHADKNMSLSHWGKCRMKWLISWINTTPIPDFHMSRWACNVSPHCGERWRNSSSFMAHRSFPVSSWKDFPAWGNLYRCSVHSSHFCTFPLFHSMGSSIRKGREKKLRYGEYGEKNACCHDSKIHLVWCRWSNEFYEVNQENSLFICCHMLYIPWINTGQQQFNCPTDLINRSNDWRVYDG